MKRFYREAAVAREGAGWRVRLDGRPIRTAGGAAQVVPTRALAEALAGEWSGQGETIDPARFGLRDLADFALDVAGPRRAATLAALLAYAASDTLLYRADPNEPLHARQREAWEPLVAAAEQRLGVRFARASGIMPRPQPDATPARLEAVLARSDAFALAALHALTGLAASLIVGLAALEPDADGEALWAAAELEEAWQAELWGRDAEAERRRAARAAAFAAARRFAELASSAGSEAEASGAEAARTPLA